jgi:tripartite-type tricarboxylate transporter receptor subunit TctC
VARLSTVVQNVLTTPELRSRMIEIGFLPIAMTPQGYRAHIEREIAKWARVITAGNIKPE